MHCQYIQQLSLLTLLSLPGTLAQTWSVWYRDRDRTICASKGSSVVFDCIYSYPTTNVVIRKIWFTPRGNTKQDGSQQGDGVYNPSGSIMKRYSGRTAFYNQENNCTLKLNNVTEDDSGKYFFRFVSNKRNQDPQGFTGLMGVDLKISVLSLKLNEDGPVKERDNITLVCTSNCNPPHMEYLWFKDGRPLPGVSGGQYPLGPLSPNDTGFYSCCLGQGTSTPIRLDVRYAPKDVSVKVNPSPEVVKGNRLTLTCSNNANPAAETYTWFQRTGPLTSLRLGMGKQQTFNKIDSDDSGLYFCMAQNALGSQNSTDLEVKVKESSHLMVVLAALGAFFLVTAVIVVLYVYIRRIHRRKWNTAEKNLPTKPVTQIQKATLSTPEDIYENTRQSAKPNSHPDDLDYIELNIRPAPSPRRQWNNKAEDDDAVLYSQLQTH